MYWMTLSSDGKHLVHFSSNLNHGQKAKNQLSSHCLFEEIVFQWYWHLELKL